MLIPKLHLQLIAEVFPIVPLIGASFVSLFDLSPLHLDIGSRESGGKGQEQIQEIFGR